MYSYHNWSKKKIEEYFMDHIIKLEEIIGLKNKRIHELEKKLEKYEKSLVENV